MAPRDRSHHARVKHEIRARLLFAMALCACGATAPSPAFEGRETDSWIAYDVAVPDTTNTGDLVASFKLAARTRGCQAAWMGKRTVMLPGGGWARLRRGVTAQCDEGTIAIIALENAVRVGCEKPTTRERCDALLRSISDGN